MIGGTARKGRWRPHPHPGRLGGFDRDPEHIRLGKYIRDARLAADLSKRELAQRLRRVTSFVAKIETAQRRVYIDDFLQIAGALNVDAAEFLDGFRGRAG